MSKNNPKSKRSTSPSLMARLSIAEMKLKELTSEKETAISNLEKERILKAKVLTTFMALEAVFSQHENFVRLQREAMTEYAVDSFTLATNQKLNDEYQSESFAMKLSHIVWARAHRLVKKAFVEVQRAINPGKEQVQEEEKCKIWS